MREGEEGEGDILIDSRREGDRSSERDRDRDRDPDPDPETETETETEKDTKDIHTESACEREGADRQTQTNR